MSDHLRPRVSTTSLTMLLPFLDALDRDRQGLMATTAALPEPSYLIAPIRTNVCGTPIVTPRFRPGMLTMAWRLEADVLVIRHGSHPEILDEVAVDVTVGRRGPAQIFWNYVPFRAPDRRLWLVPPPGQISRSLSLGAAGLIPVARQPYRDIDGRSDGVERAARETVLTLRRARSS